MLKQPEIVLCMRVSQLRADKRCSVFALVHDDDDDDVDHVTESGELEVTED